MREGRAWFDAALTDLGAQHTPVAAAVQSRALADKAVLDAWMGDVDSLDQAEQALAIARELREPALLARALTACGFCAGQGYNTALAQKYFAEAIGLARALDDRWRLSQVLAWETGAGAIAGDPSAVRAAGREGRDLADSIGDKFHSRQCRHWLGYAQMIQGDVAGAIAELGRVVIEAEAAHDEISRVVSLGTQAIALAYQGQVAAARAAADETLDGGLELGGRFAAFAYVVLGFAALAAGDGAAVHQTREAGRQYTTVVGTTVAVQRISNVESALVDGDLAVARNLADEAIPGMTGWYSVWMLTLRARVAIATGEFGQADRDARGALELGAAIRSHLGIPNILECLAVLAGKDGNHRDAARLFAAAQAMWQRIGAARFKVYDPGHQASVSDSRKALGDTKFDHAWAEGMNLSTEQAIAYARRAAPPSEARPPAGQR